MGRKLRKVIFPRKMVDDLLRPVPPALLRLSSILRSKIETEQIVPAAEGGPYTIDNAIPVCFECHAEIHSYNDKHPRGRKLTQAELKRHKEQLLELCKYKPEMFLYAA
ncbi:HNH endonuclease signature motif containing protein [Nitrospira sp. M1]